MEIWQIPLHIVRYIVSGSRQVKSRRRRNGGLVRGRVDRGHSIKTLEVICSSAPRIIPSKSLIDVVTRESCRRPVVAIGASLRIHKKAVQQSKTQRERMSIRSYVLNRIAGSSCGSSGTKDCNRRLSIRLCAIAALIDVAKNLVVRSVFANYINNVLERRLTAWKEARFFGCKQSIVSHRLLRIVEQGFLVGNSDEAE